MIQAATQAPVAGRATEQAANPQLVYRGLRDQREILGEQMRTAQSTRDRLVRDLRESGGPAGDASRVGIEKRIANVDARIADLDKQIAASDAAVAQAAAVPGATVRPPTPPRDGPPEEAFFLAGFLGFIVLFPLTIAYARRIWRRSARAEVTIPAEMRDRMESLERGVEAIALEVERIGEGQRFVTRALAERQAMPAIGAGQQAPAPAYLRSGEKSETRR